MPTSPMRSASWNLRGTMVKSAFNGPAGVKSGYTRMSCNLHQAFSQYDGDDIQVAQPGHLNISVE
jgi:hypothetical protein